jgi:CheY-like chemotaxis protein
VVLVDDTESDRFTMSIVLEKSRLQNEVVCLEDGRAAIEHIEAVSAGRFPIPALMLVDVNMPGITGFEVLRFIKSKDDGRRSPIIAMLTSSDAEADMQRAEELGADDYLPKQSGLAKFVSLVNERFRNARPGSGTPIGKGDAPGA